MSAGVYPCTQVASLGGSGWGTAKERAAQWGLGRVEDKDAAAAASAAAAAAVRFRGRK